MKRSMSKTRKRTLGISLVLFVMSITLFGCGGGGCADNCAKCNKHPKECGDADEHKCCYDGTQKVCYDNINSPDPCDTVEL